MLTLNFPFFVKAQLEGKYCGNFECIEFKKDGSFKYYKETCFSWIGEGKYEINGKILKLHFGKKPDLLDVEETKTSNDSIELNFSLMDSQKYPILGAIIIIENRQNNILKGTYSDENGKANLKLIKSTEIIYLSIEYINSIRKVQLLQDKNYDIRFTPYEDYSFITDTSKIYTIKLQTKKKIYLKKHDKYKATYKYFKIE